MYIICFYAYEFFFVLFSAYIEREMKVKIKQWHGVASWLWVANDENCGICRAPFNGCCPDCRPRFCYRNAIFISLAHTHCTVLIGCL